MNISKNAADAYSLFKKTKKIRTYGKLVKEAINEDTRPGAFMKLGIRGMLDITGKALGTSLTSHPYFKYHKVHLEALVQALNASSNFEKAQEALNRAIHSADAAERLTKYLCDYQSLKQILKWHYRVFIARELELLRDYKSIPQVESYLKDSRVTPEYLKSETDQQIYGWRARWCELFLDSVQLLAMAQVELRATEAAMQRFDEKMKALSSGGGIGKIFSYRVQQNRQWEQLDRMTTPGTGSEEAVENPVGFARDQVNDIEKVTDLLGEACEIAMSDDAYSPDKINLRLGSL